MSHQGPTGFVFSLLVEVAAVVAIVSFLPRINLRPSATAADIRPPAQDGFLTAQPPLSSIRFTESKSPEPAPRETSYVEPRPIQPPQIPPQFPRESSREAPPLIPVDLDRPQYVEQRLDRASQQLVNSVGSAVTQAADTMFYIPPQPPAPAGRATSFAEPTVAPPRIRPPVLSRYLPH